MLLALGRGVGGLGFRKGTSATPHHGLDLPCSLLSSGTMCTCKQPHQGTSPGAPPVTLRAPVGKEVLSLVPAIQSTPQGSGGGALTHCFRPQTFREHHGQALGTVVKGPHPLSTGSSVLRGQLFWVRK